MTTYLNKFRLNVINLNYKQSKKMESLTISKNKKRKPIFIRKQPDQIEQIKEKRFFIKK